MNALVKFLQVSVASLFVAGVAFAQQTTGEGPVQTPGAQGGAAPGWLNLALLVGMIFFMWFFIMRPQAKRQKEHKVFLDSLKAGQEVITSGGLIGKVTSVSDTIVTVDLGSGSVRVLKSAISGELNRQAATAGSAT